MTLAPIKVGLIGLGTVGQGVVRLLKGNATEISRRLGRELIVTHAAARDMTRKRDCDLQGITVVSDPLSIIRDTQVDIVVEVMGGTGLARDLVLAAIAQGKHVVTANKALIAEYGNALFAAARDRGVMLAFEAAVAGGIPIVKTIREGMAGNRIDSIAGSINGTCNYILTQMTLKGQSFADALAAAQKLGYAEADPTFDIEGVDSSHKLAILASIAFGMPLSFAEVACEGITKITAQDIEIAQALGYRIKLLGIAKRGEHGVEMRVQPTLIPQETLLAKIDGVLNSVLLNGNAAGQIGLYGAGAGGDATASAVIADLLDVARALDTPAQQWVPALAFQHDAVQSLKLLPMREIESAHYLRLRVADTPGVLSRITAILADHGISIEAIIQREPREEEDATLALITSVIAEHEFESALAAMLALPFVREGASHLRVEHFDD